MTRSRLLSVVPVAWLGFGCVTAPCPAVQGSVHGSHVAQLAVEPGFEPVAFLVGDWDGTSADGRFDEHWIAPRGGVMLGLGREVDAEGKARFFELMRIERRGTDLVLMPHPMGKAAKDFRLTRATAGAVVFENAGDDRVARISYAAAGDELVARIEFRATGHVDEIRMRKTGR